MVGLLLRADLLLSAFLTAADDVVGDLEGFELDPLDSSCVERMRFAELEEGLERRLGVDLGVVALEEGAADTRSSPSQSISKRPAIDSMKPLFPSNTSGGPVMPRAARKVVSTAPKAVKG
jgi:hypothetical protein